jgi:hypothetical protein
VTWHPAATAKAGMWLFLLKFIQSLYRVQDGGRVLAGNGDGGRVLAGNAATRRGSFLTNFSAGGLF